MSVGIVGYIHKINDGFARIALFPMLCVRNLVLALRDLSIRGDFRTTVEYLITLLESRDFQDNVIDTAWLDKLIAERTNVEKPDVVLGAIAGALHIADLTIRTAMESFQKSLEKYDWKSVWLDLDRLL